MSCCEESKETRFCKDCNHWTRTERADGICIMLDAESQKIMPALAYSLGSAHTWDEFGCVYFEPKSKGPFTLGHNSYGYFVRYKPTTTNLGYWTTEVDAEKTCKEMNKEWAVAKEEWERRE